LNGAVRPILPHHEEIHLRMLLIIAYPNHYKSMVTIEYFIFSLKSERIIYTHLVLRNYGNTSNSQQPGTLDHLQSLLIQGIIAYIAARVYATARGTCGNQPPSMAATGRYSFA
jgi:hypothetical protein